MVRAPFAPLLADAYPRPLVYQIECELELARDRLSTRNYTDGELDARLASNLREVDAGRPVAHRSFCNDHSPLSVADEIEVALSVDVPKALEEIR